MKISSKRLSPLCAVLGLLLGPWAAIAGDQTTTAPAEPPAEPLRAELTVDKPIYRPDGPIWLRFSLRNTSDEPVDVVLDPPAPPQDGIVLPPQIVYGTTATPAIQVVYRSEATKSVVPPTFEPSGEEGRTLRLGPHTVLGADVDLRAVSPLSRYNGDFRVDWRPLDGRLGVASVQFRVEPRKDVILVTDWGKITFVLDYDAAPRNVANFLELAREDFYNGKILHRIEPGALIQGGSPSGDSTGMRPDGKTVPAEFHNVPFDVGTLAMARKPTEPNSASCQFLIGLGRVPELDNQQTVIGQATDEESLRTLQQLAAVATDKRGRPLAPVTIRSMKPVDAEAVRTRSLELRETRRP